MTTHKIKPIDPATVELPDPDGPPVGVLSWDSRARFEMAGYLESGYDYAYIARHTGRSYFAVTNQARRLGLNVQANPRVYSVHRLEHEFFTGIYPWHIRDWARRGWLWFYRSRRGGRAMRTTHERLLAFLEDERTWLAWEPYHIQDRDTCAWAEELRAAASWRWLTAKEAARVVGVTRQAITKRCRRGYYRSATLYMHVWYIHSDELVEENGSTTPG